jgi:zinc transporter ZupT
MVALTSSTVVTAIACLLAHCRRCVADAEHENATAWEWAGVFDFPRAGHYTWHAARVNGSYAAPSMRLALVPASAASSSGLEAAEERLEAAYSGVASPLASGGEMVVGKAHVLEFDPRTWTSQFFIHVDSPGPLAFAAEHVPTEFENGFHYLKSEAGEDIEPTAQRVAHEEEEPVMLAGASGTKKDKEWGTVLLGSFVTCLPTLVGCLCLPCMTSPRATKVIERSLPSVSAFASGVLSAAAVFLLLPEALHLTAIGATSEVESVWTWGTCILAGWFTCVLIHHAWCLLFDGNRSECEPTTQEVAAAVSENSRSNDVSKDHGVDEVAKVTTSQSGNSGNSRMDIAGPVLFGDLFHNLADGLLIGTAFKNCSSSFAWSLVGVTVCHELPQEIADLAILVTKAGLKWHWATLANFAVSLTTVIGAAITYETEFDSNWEGYILAYGAGVYLFIAMTELGPAVTDIKRQSVLRSMEIVIAFVLGCVLIGLVLLDHKHCSAPPSGESAAVDPHAGHNH